MISLREALLLEGAGVVSLVGAGGKTSLMFRLARELSLTGDSVLTTTTTKIFEPSPDQCAGVILSERVADILDRTTKRLKTTSHVTAAAGRLPGTGKLYGFQPEFIGELWRAGRFRWIVVEADGADGRPLKAPAGHEPVIPDCTTRLVGLAGLNAVGQPLTDRLVFRLEHFVRLTGLQPDADINETAIAEVLVHAEGLFKGFNPQVTRVAFLNQADTGDNLSIGRRIAGILKTKKNTGLSRVVVGQLRCTPPVLDIFALDP